MFKQQFFPILLATMMLFQPGIASAVSISRLVKGTITLLESGTVVNKEIPVPNAILMSSNGQSLIENEKLHLAIADKTIFAIQEESTHSNLLIMEGSVDFTIKPGSNPLRFKPFSQNFTGSNPYLVPANSETVCRGTLLVTKDKASLTMSEGSLKIVSIDGQTIHRGDTLVLDQAATAIDAKESPDTDAPATEAAETGAANTATQAAATGAANIGTNLGMTVLSAATASIVSVGTSIITNSNDDDGDKKASPF